MPATPPLLGQCESSLEAFTSNNVKTRWTWRCVSYSRWRLTSWQATPTALMMSPTQGGIARRQHNTDNQPAGHADTRCSLQINAASALNRDRIDLLNDPATSWQVYLSNRRAGSESSIERWPYDQRLASGHSKRKLSTKKRSYILHCLMCMCDCVLRVP